MSDWIDGLIWLGNGLDRESPELIEGTSQPIRWRLDGDALVFDVDVEWTDINQASDCVLMTDQDRSLLFWYALRPPADIGEAISWHRQATLP